MKPQPVSFLSQKNVKKPPFFRQFHVKLATKKMRFPAKPPPCKTLNVTLLNGQKLYLKCSPKRPKKQARNKHKTALGLVSLTANCSRSYGLLRTIASLSLLAELLLDAPGPLALTASVCRSHVP